MFPMKIYSMKSKTTIPPPVFLSIIMSGYLHKAVLTFSRGHHAPSNVNTGGESVHARACE